MEDRAKKLRSLANFQMGINKGRVKETNMMLFYNSSDMLRDLQSDDNLIEKEVKLSKRKKYVLESGDVVYSLVTDRMAIVSEANGGKLFDQNFIKVSLNRNLINAKYLCYCINESLHVRHQLEVVSQGSSVHKVLVSELMHISIEYPSMEKQRLIGEIYFNIR